MNNPNTPYQNLLTAMQERWPHDHLLVLWLAPITALLAVFLHIPMPWTHDILPQTLGSLALLILPGSLLLQWFAPHPKDATETFFSPSYLAWNKISQLILLPALIGVGVGWFYASPLGLSLSLSVLALSRWITQLQPRVFITPTHTWHLGFPINVVNSLESVVRSPEENGPEENVSESGVRGPGSGVRGPGSDQQVEESVEGLLGVPVHRGRWRLVLFGLLWVVWSVGVVSLTLGPKARLSVIWSIRTLILWGLGSLVCFQLSRLFPSWRAPKGARYLWQERSSAWLAFLSISIPSSLLTLGLTLPSTISQLFLVPTHTFHPQTVFFNLLLTIITLTLLFDPSGTSAWIAEKDNTLYARRFGWIERFDGSFETKH